MISDNISEGSSGQVSGEHDGGDKEEELEFDDDSEACTGYDDIDNPNTID
jgi:hypothetical protein